MGFLPRLKKSACGCSLQKGSLIIAYWNLIGITFQLVAGICLYLAFKEEFEIEIERGGLDGNEGLILVWIRAAFIVTVVTAVCAFALESLLLVGIYKRNHWLMVPWLIIDGVGLVIVSFVLIFGFFLSTTMLQMFLIGIGIHIIIGFGSYCYLVIYSLFCEIQDERRLNDKRFNPLHA